MYYLWPADWGTRAQPELFRFYNIHTSSIYEYTLSHTCILVTSTHRNKQRNTYMYISYPDRKTQTKKKMVIRDSTINAPPNWPAVSWNISSSVLVGVDVLLLERRCLITRYCRKKTNDSIGTLVRMNWYCFQESRIKTFDRSLRYFP